MGRLGRWLQGLGRRRADAARSLAEVSYLVVDTELTGLDPARDDIVAIGAVRMEGGRILVGSGFHELVQPSAALDGRSVVIHRITPTQVADRPRIDAVLGPFLERTRGTVLVGHCLALDLAFLNREARRCLGAPLDLPLLDTLSLYGWLRHRHLDHPALQRPLSRISLTELAEAFGIPVETAHSALADAYTTAQLFQRFLPLLTAAGITQLGDLLRIGDPLRQAENLQAPGGQVLF
jgi:DNA polymerase-3 subunit epsilon